MCTGNKKVEVVPYGGRSDYVEVFKKIQKEEKARVNISKRLRI